ncbi:MAG: SEC-C domain-containing protein [Armatimonadetes bacterium]|nr:SEC-C domain-containing protein [Armatimonadota bacterium]
MTNLMDPCVCGSGKAYGRCCGRTEPCSCGSGKQAQDCCFRGN